MSKKSKSKNKIFNSHEHIIPHYVQYKYNHIKVDDKLMQIYYVRSYPAKLERFACLSKLSKIDQVQIIQKNTPLNKDYARKLMSEKFKSNNMTFFNSKDQSERVVAGVDSKHVEDVITQLYEKNRVMYDVTTFIVVTAFNKDELEAKKSEINSTLIEYGMSAGTTDTITPEAYRSTLLHKNETVKGIEQNMLSSSLSFMYPFVYGDRVDEDGIFLGYEANTKGNIIIDFFDRSKLPNSNILVLGGSGQGKSFIMKKILAYMIGKKYITYSIDSDNSEYQELTEKLEGANLRFGNKKYYLNPMEFMIGSNENDVIIDNVVDDNEDTIVSGYFDKDKSICLRHIAWLRDWFKLYKNEMTEYDFSVLEDLLIDFYKSWGLYEVSNAKKIPSHEFPIFSDFYDYIKRMKQNFVPGDHDYGIDVLSRFLVVFKSLSEGVDSEYFNGHTNIPNSNNINFDIKDIISMKGTIKTTILYSIITFIWSKITDTSAKIKKMLLIDELHLLMDDSTSIMVDFVKEISKRIRKYLGSLCAGSQQISDFLIQEIMNKTKPIISNSVTKFLFFPGNDEMPDFHKILQCTAEELELIKTSNRGHCLMFAGNKKYFLNVAKVGYEDELFGAGGGA